MAEQKDRRVRRTRAALIGAFNDLILRSGRKKVRVADIVERADVGRSTFYDHYNSAEDLHMEALAQPLAVLADAVTGTGDAERLQWLLEHFWDNRQRARETLNGEQRDRVTRLLARLIEEKLDGGTEYRLPVPMVALQLAEAALAPIRGWIAALGVCDSRTLARSISLTSTSVRGALTKDGPTR